MAKGKSQPEIDPGQIQHDREFAEIEAEFGTEFVHYDEQLAAEALAKPEIPDKNKFSENRCLKKKDIQNHRDLVLESINKVLKGESLSVLLPIWATQVLTREEIIALEVEGLVFAGVNEEHPDGGVYVNNHFKSSLKLESSDALGPEQVIDETLQAIYVTGALRGVTGLHARKPADKIPDNLKGLPRIPTNSLVATVFKDGKWGKSHVLPDGRWIVEGFDTTAFQYAQGCFEGMVASDAMGIEAEVRDRKVTLFRPEENAKRFIASCKLVGLPPISVSQFIAAVEAAVKNNKNFIPENGKLYIRPFIAGLRGGTGIHPATQCLFAVEVSPYGEYMPSARAEEAEEVSGVDLKSVEFDRPVFARGKVIPNYSPSIPHKVQAESEKFNDILTITSKGTIQECGSSNFFMVHSIGDTFVFLTPTLEENILPGITRKSLIELLKDPAIQKRLGRKIQVIDNVKIDENTIHNMSGAFGTGTAAGITNVKRIRTLDGRDKHFEDMETFRLLMDIKELLGDLRRGKIKGYESWVMEV